MASAAPVSSGAGSQLSVQPNGVASPALPPHIAPVTPVDHDGDADIDVGTIFDTFA